MRLQILSSNPNSWETQLNKEMVSARQKQLQAKLMVQRKNLEPKQAKSGINLICNIKEFKQIQMFTYDLVFNRQSKHLLTFIKKF